MHATIQVWNYKFIYTCKVPRKYKKKKLTTNLSEKNSRPRIENMIFNLTCQISSHLSYLSQVWQIQLTRVIDGHDNGCLNESYRLELSKAISYA